MKLFSGNSKDVNKLSDKEITLLGCINVDPDVALAIKEKTKYSIEGLYELQMFDEYAEEPKLRGIKSKVSEKITMPDLYQEVKELQADNNFKDYHIFSCGHFGSDKDYFIGAVKTNDQFDCLRIFET